MKHAWYSPTMDAISGAVYWIDANGVEVRCTCVTYSATDSGTKWRDIEYVGPVVQHSRGYLIDPSERNFWAYERAMNAYRQQYPEGE